MVELAHFTKEVEFLGLRGVEFLFGAFEKIKCIFSIAPVENLEKSRECFSLTGRTARRHRTLAFNVRCTVGSVKSAPDAPE